MKKILLCIMLVMCITTSSYATVTAESSPPAPTDEVPTWVSLAQVSPLTAYWSEGEYIFAVGSAARMLDILNQKFAAVYMAAENSARAKGLTEADVTNIRLKGVWKDPATGVIFVLIRVHQNNIVEVSTGKQN